MFLSFFFPFPAVEDQIVTVNHKEGVDASLSLTERLNVGLDISECFDLQRSHFVQFTNYLFTHSVFY